MLLVWSPRSRTEGALLDNGSAGFNREDLDAKKS